MTSIDPHPEPTGNHSNRAEGRSFRWTIPILVVVACVAIVRLPKILTATGQTSPAIGKPAPQLDLVRLDDQPSLEHLRSLPSGSVTLIHFWGTWCGPCRMEFPDLAAMARRHRSESSFVFLPVSCEGHGEETFDGLLDKTNRYFESEGIHFASYADPRGVTRRSVAQRLGTNSMVYPTSVVIDDDGKIVGVWEGYAPSTVSQMESLILRLLKDQSSRKASS